MTKEKQLLIELLKTIKKRKLNNYRLDGFFDIATRDMVVLDCFLPKWNIGFIVRSRKNTNWKDFYVIKELKKIGIECVILTYIDFSDIDKLKKYFPLAFKSLDLMCRLQEMYCLYPKCESYPQVKIKKAERYICDNKYKKLQKAEVDLQIRRKKCQENGVELVIV